MELEEYLDDIEDLADDPVYRATWFYVFGEDSCTRYDINAEGPGAAEIEADIRVALSFYDLTESKEIAIHEGYGGAFE